MRSVGTRLINAQKLVTAITNAFENWATEDIDDAHWDDQFQDMSRWDWSGENRRDGSNETRRKNGEIVDSPRDIYDLGNLYRSKQYSLVKRINGIEAKWSWNATNSSGQEYAYYVHEGTTKTDARPFTDDISIPSSFKQKAPGMALIRQMQASLSLLNAN
jgi:hypothetical protein